MHVQPVSRFRNRYGFLKVSESPSVEPMALSLSAAVGGLKFMAKATEKAEKSAAEITIRFIIL